MSDQRALLSKLQRLQARERSYLRANAIQASQIAELQLARRCPCWTKPSCSVCERVNSQAVADRAVKRIHEKSGAALVELQAKRRRQAERQRRGASAGNSYIEVLRDCLQRAETTLHTAEVLVKTMTEDTEGLAAQQAELSRARQVRDSIIQDLTIQLMLAESCSEATVEQKVQVAQTAQHVQTAGAALDECTALFDNVMQGQLGHMHAIQHCIPQDEPSCASASAQLTGMINALACAVNEHQKRGQAVKMDFCAVAGSEKEQAVEGSKAKAAKPRRRVTTGLNRKHGQSSEVRTAVYSSSDTAASSGVSRKRKPSATDAGNSQCYKRSRVEG